MLSILLDAAGPGAGLQGEETDSAPERVAAEFVAYI